MKTTTVLGFSLSSVALLGACATSLEDIRNATEQALQSASKGLQDISSSGQAGSTTLGNSGVESSGIVDIFVDEPFDSSRKSDAQWPRVAITVLDSPSWVGGEHIIGLGQLPTGCFTLQATIWRSASSQNQGEPFQWCSPNDISYDTPLAQYEGWASRWKFYEAVQPHSGNNRTKGPTPPATFVPTTIKYKRALPGAFSSGESTSYGPTSHIGLMVYSIAAVAGIDPAESADHRIWFTTIDPVE